MIHLSLLLFYHQPLAQLDHRPLDFRPLDHQSTQTRSSQEQARLEPPPQALAQPQNLIPKRAPAAPTKRVPALTLKMATARTLAPEMAANRVMWLPTSWTPSARRLAVSLTPFLKGHKK